MRFNQQQDAKLPEVNLIPMLNVMMGILAFFVMITMTLSNQKLLELQLPADSEEAPPPVTSADLPFVVKLDAQGQIRVNDQPLETAQLEQQIQAYLAENEKNIVYLMPDPQLPYEQVVQFLGQMRAVGGDRVSLAIEEPAEEAQ